VWGPAYGVKAVTKENKSRSVIPKNGSYLVLVRLVFGQAAEAVVST
jgi:hypothetical protein